MDATRQQRLVMDAEGVTVLGVDEKGRPVVSAMAGIPRQMRTWAVLRNGDPTDVTGEVRRES